MGPEVAAFERETSRWVGRRHAVATHSGTTALQLALSALGAGPGREVVCPSYVCSAVLNAILANGAKPVVADVDRQTTHLTAGLVKKALTRQAAAVIVPHLFGRPAPVREIVRLGVPLVEDCAMTLGPPGVGRQGTVSILSFYATKLLTSGGQGGMALTDDPRLAARIRDLLLHDNRERYRLRFNAQMTDLAAAVGRVQLGRLRGFLKARRRMADRYTRALDGVALPYDARDPARAWFRYTVEVSDASKAARTMARRGVEAKPPVFKPLHRYLELDPKRFPGTEAIWKRTLSIPLYPSLTAAEQDQVIRSLAVRS
jgi:perosamine synthetase